MLAAKLLSSINVDTIEPPEGVSFDGKTDYLSRSSDLVGNVDGKTFTFSCWLYVPDATTANIYLFQNGSEHLTVQLNSTGLLRTILRDSANVIKVDFQTALTEYAENTWVHYMFSIDTTSSSLRWVYINDRIPTVTWTTYLNAIIDTTDTSFRIGESFGNYFKGRLSHLFLDYTYRDLSIEANRRLFITADGKPADGLASLNPILYLPMKDASTAHINLGTGGNFVQNGTLATADRGANQDNCVASKFDGVDDCLSKTFSGVTDTKTLTFSINTLTNNLSGIIYHSTNGRINISIGDGLFNIQLYNSADATIMVAYISLSTIGLAANKIVNINFSCDMANTANRHFIVNGNEYTLTYANYNNINLSFNNITNIGRSTSSVGYVNGSIGELYFDTNYIDLATNNPFWDSETNKPIPVRKAMATLGSNPLICMPIDASNPTKNYGSGGNFTLNGGGLVGARGASEYIARGLHTASTATNQGLSIASLGGSATTDNLSAVIIFKTAIVTNNQSIFSTYNGVTNKTIAFGIESSTWLKFQLGVITGRIRWSQVYPTIIFLYKNGNTQKIDVYSNGVLLADSFTQVYAQTLDLSGNAFVNQSNLLTGYTAGLNGVSYSTYLADTFIDFSQESNRNLFVNQLGYPRDLTPEIEAGNIPTPLIYLPFDNTSNLGKNLGTGGDFTVKGTVTAGADFSL